LNSAKEGGCVTLGEREYERIIVNSTAPTPQQQRAISARGNVLVVAGAGAGKTQTVVDRCLVARWS